MNLPIINGRQAVPVRLIPIITRGLGQETLAGILANRLNIGGWNFDSDFDEIDVDVFDEETGTTERTTKTRAELVGPQWRDNKVAAFHLKDGNTPVQMWASEWEVTFREIRLLEPVLRKREKKIGVPQSMEPVWRLKATKVLPPGVFLWREDVDLLWQRHTDYYGRTQFDPADFRSPVNYDAYVRPEYQALVLEGFEHLMNQSEEEALSLQKLESAKLIQLKEARPAERTHVDTGAKRKSSATAPPRNDALKKVILEVVTEFLTHHDGTPKCIEVLNSIKRLAKAGNHPVIQEVKNNVIYWRRANGKEEKTTFPALQKRLSGINKVQKSSR